MIDFLYLQSFDYATKGMRLGGCVEDHRGNERKFVGVWAWRRYGARDVALNVLVLVFGIRGRGKGLSKFGEYFLIS